MQRKQNLKGPMKKEKSIVFIHMLNNFSGSPNVLSVVAEEIYRRGIETNIITSFNNQGFLSNTPASKKININYSFYHNKLLRLFEFVKFQILSTFSVLSQPKEKVIYINTILPFLPAIISKLKGNRVIYHIHEAYPQKGIFQKICFWCAEFASEKILCVSQYVKNNLSETAKQKAVVIYNALDSSFTDNIIEKKKHPVKTLLMISSARTYKGILEFAKLSSELPAYNFVLVCDASEKEIEQIFPEKYLILSNLKIYSTQKNLHPFYASADLIVNFSNPHLIVETFGLTILEGMYYGLPAIVPTIGGITELVDNEENGLKIDVNDFDTLKKGVISIFETPELYNKMSKKALLKAQHFDRDIQIQKINDELF